MQSISSVFLSLALATTASAQIDVTNPVIGNEEFAGLSTVVTFDLSAGLEPTGILFDGEVIEVSFDLVDVNDITIFGPFSVNTLGGNINYVNAAGNSDIKIDLNTVTFATGLVNSQVSAFRLNCRTAGGTGFQVVSTQFSPTEPTDEHLDAVKAGNEPVLLSAILNTDLSKLRLTFDQPLSNGNPINDDNNTVPAELDGFDLQLSGTPTFTGFEGPMLGLFNASFGIEGSSVIVFDYDPIIGSLFDGAYIRPAYDQLNRPTPNMSIRESLGYRAKSDSVQLAVVGSPDPCPSDLNNDGAVNAADLAVLLADWGLCKEPS